MHAHTHTHMYACISTHTFVHLHPDMKSIKIKANDFYEKKEIHTCNFTSSERSERGKFLVIILPKLYLNLHTFIHMHY